MNIKINATKVLVEDITESVDKTPSGILIPNMVKTNNMKGTVLVIGEGNSDIRIVYEVGDTVLYHPNAGSKFTFDGKELRLLDVNEIFLGGRI